MEIPRGSIGYRLCNELEGLLTGIRADGRIVKEETTRLLTWLADSEPYQRVRPFTEISRHIEAVLSDGIVTIDECDDLLFVIQRFTTVNPHFCAMRTGLQVLHGLVAGIAADQRIPDSEVQKLQAWISDWAHLSGTWPYDECEALVAAAVKSDSAPARTALIQLAADFPIGGANEDGRPPLIGAICAIDPVVVFKGRQFVFTGESSRCERRELAERVTERGGSTHDSVTSMADYLIVCDNGNPHWAFACYGRKVEKAYLMRREGHSIAIIHERDFWDAIGS